jgi:hypothetical protein
MLSCAPTYAVGTSFAYCELNVLLEQYALLCTDHFGAHNHGAYHLAVVDACVFISK